MEINDALLEELWTLALRTPPKPKKTRRRRIMTKWRRSITRAQKAYLKAAWDDGETVVVYEDNDYWRMRSSTRMDIWHSIDMNEKTCSCEAAGEFQTTKECRHLRRMRSIAVNQPSLDRVLRFPVATAKPLSMTDHLRRSAVVA